MRITIVNSIRSWGGGEKWVLRAAAGLQARGHRVTVLGHPEGELAQRCVAEGVAFSPVVLRSDVAPAAVLALARALRSAPPDVVLCCNQRALRVGAIAVPLAVPRRRPPLLFRDGLAGSFKNKAYNRFVVGPRVARYVVNAEAIRQELLSFGWIPPGRVRLIYNGIDTSAIDRADPAGAREELGAGAQDVVVLVAARMVPEKGHALLLDVIGQMAAEWPRLKVWIAGEGSEAERLAGQVKALGLPERVRLLGFRPDVPRLLRAADLLCHPSRREGAPNVVLEAMAAGLPVVGMAAQGTAELVIAGETGLLAPVGDAAALRRHLEAVLADRDLRRRLGEAGRRRVLAEFSEDRSMQRWSELLEEVALHG